MSMGKIVGSIMLVMGMMIGGGVLALPMVSVGSGFISIICLLLFMWLLMVVTGFLYLEVNLSLPPGNNSFTSMASNTLGRPGKIVMFISYLLLLYALVAAYISGGGSLLGQILLLCGVHLSSAWNCLLFAGLLGAFVCHGIKAVDYVNRMFFSIKASFLVLALILLTPYIDFSNPLINHGELKYLWAGVPIFLFSFGYQPLIPSLTNYLNRDPKSIRFVIVTGTLLTMLIYAFWILELWSIISIDSFIAFVQAQGSTGEFIAMAMNSIESKWVGFTLNGFANVTITTSFLGVSLSLFDFLADAIPHRSVRWGRTITALVTFVPPICFAIFYPQGFILALGYAAICVAFSLLILPALMVWQLRKKSMPPSYRVFGGKPLLIFVLLTGLVLIVLQVLASRLPIFSG
ncbi:MAG: tyrP 1 [Parachlamydiales bacterium]|nr:tyrP 1 [Parachlamydiales bacterium]